MALPSPRSASDDDYRDLELGARQQAVLSVTVGLRQQIQDDDEHAKDLDLNVPLKAFFRQGLPVNIFVPVCVIFASWFNYKGAGILSWSFSGISVACLVATFLLHCFTSEWIQKVSARCKLAYLSVLLRIVAATFLLLFLDPAVRHLVVILPLSLLVLVLLRYFFWETFTEHRRLGENWADHGAELKLRFDLSSGVVTFAFAGLFGTVVGYVKEDGSSDHHQRLPLMRRGRGYMSPDCFLSYSLVLGLLLQLLSTVPAYIYNMGTRRRMAKVYLRIVGYASLAFLVLASVVAAEEILREWVSIACFVFVVIPVLFFWLENRNSPLWFSRNENGLLRWCFSKIPRRIRQEQDDDDNGSQVMLGFVASLFAALMASNSKYSIERSGGTAVSLSGWFKCSVLLELYGVLSYAVRMVAFSEMSPAMRSLAFTKMVWNLSATATITITIILVLVIRCLHPDEIKNVF